MSWSNDWGSTPQQSTPQPTINPTPANPWDSWNQDQVLMHWQSLKEQLAKIKEDEMNFRKYVIKRAFPAATEGTNTLELGGGYALKAKINFNYKLADNDTVEAGLARIAKIGNSGPFVADRLISWHPNFLKSEWNNLQEEANKGSGEARAILKEVSTFLTIEDAAPALDIKQPKAKK